MKTKPSQQSVGILRTDRHHAGHPVCRCERPMARSTATSWRCSATWTANLVIEEKDVATFDLRGAAGPGRQQDWTCTCWSCCGLHVNHLDCATGGDGGALIRAANGRGGDRGGRQVHQPARRLQEHLRGADARRDRQRREGSRCGMVESEESRPGRRGAADGRAGVLVPGGFRRPRHRGQDRGVRYARENGIPFFGICLGMQCAVMEFARNVCGLAGANSTEFDARHAAPGDRPDGSSSGGSGQGRHDAAGRLPLPAGGGHAGARGYGADIPSATATATSSTTTTARLVPRAACVFPAVAGRRAGRNVELRPSVVCGLPVSSGISIDAAQGAPAVRGFVGGALRRDEKGSGKALKSE
jgi:hypothetical protein